MKTYATNEREGKMEIQTKPKIDHTPAELDKSSRLLLRAADLLEREGLNQESAAYTCKDGRLCVMAAINVANGDLPDALTSNDDAKHEALTRLQFAVDEIPFRWILQPGVTPMQVIAKMRAVALSG